MDPTQVANLGECIGGIAVLVTSRESALPEIQHHRSADDRAQDPSFADIGDRHREYVAIEDDKVGVFAGFQRTGTIAGLIRDRSIPGSDA